MKVYELDTVVLAIFIVVYMGMILGRIPGLALDRTGVALLGAIALFALGKLTMTDAWQAIDLPTIALLFGLMVVSAQFRMGGFYSHLVRRIASVDISPRNFLALIIGISGLLSALLVNDIVCLAVTPVLIECCAKKNLDPKPFLLALACSANVGSAATLIGNPQNMLIGQVLKLSFGGYLVDALVPSMLGLVAVWIIICLLTRNRWSCSTRLPEIISPVFNSGQTIKGSIVLILVMLFFLAGKMPREIVALAAAGVILCSRQMRSREILGLVDWQLLILFLSLFIVNYSLRASGNLEQMMSSLTSAGINPENPQWLFMISVVLSNLVSNVPAVMLLLPSATNPVAGAILALSSTLAGNLLLVGSIANIIVVDQSAQLGVNISWRDHARIGVPVTIVTLIISAAWLWIRY